jgi:hypothetical protein
VRRLGAFLTILLLSCAKREAALVSLDAGVDDLRPEITSCDEALRSGRNGDACSFGDCLPIQRTPCCRQGASCIEGELTIDWDCIEDCTTCLSGFDTECRLNQICVESRCVDCPAIDQCQPCAPGLEPVVRNGCTLCECMPASACISPSDCGPELECIGGQVCRDGCIDQFTCCANACGARTCVAPAPVGCTMLNCPPELGCEYLCMAAECRCTETEWVCRAVCITPDLDPPCRTDAIPI